MAIFQRAQFLSIAALALFAASSLVAGDATQMRLGAERSGASSESADLAGLASFTASISTKVTAGAIAAEPLVIGDRIFVVGDNAGEGSDLVCLSATTGAILWRNMLSSRVLATPATSFDIIVVGMSGGEVVAYNTQDGAERWSMTHAGFQSAAIAIEGTSVVVAPGFGNDALICLDLFSGAEKWRTPLDRFANGSPAIFDGKVLLALPNGSVEAYDLATGAILWKSGFEAKGVYYGVSPTIAHDPASATTYLYVAPGGDEVGTGATITGFKGYVTYRINTENGAMQRMTPSSTAALPSYAEGGEPSAPISAEALKMLPPKLLREIAAFTDTESQIKAIEHWETTMGFDFTQAKVALRALAAEREARKTDQRLPSLPSLDGDVLTPHTFDSNWPSASFVRPAAAAYLARGSNKFLALAMREEGSSLGTPDRTILFSIDPTNGSAQRWFYSAVGLSSGELPFMASPIFVPKTSDANGAWLLAPLGRHLAVFDAAGNNAPVAQYAMPDSIQAAPVFANGRLVLTDRSGNLRVLTSLNAAPSAPQISAPLSGVDIASSGTVNLHWSAASDDTTSGANLRYEVKQMRVHQGTTNGSITALAAGSTSLALTSLLADSDFSFQVRAIDSEGNAGAWSSPTAFSYLPDRKAPFPANSFTLSARPLGLELTFGASPDEAPNGDADVKLYRADVIDLDGAANYVVNLGLSHNRLIDGMNPATPLIVGHRYNVRLYAVDGRGNLSLSIIRSATVLSASEYDVTPPHVSEARLRDLGGRGVIDGVEVSFSEAISFANININGFKLDGRVARSYSKISESKILIDFGSGSTGTASGELSFDEATGLVHDLKANYLRSFGATDVSELDDARPILLASSLIAHDDNGDGRPDRIVGRFSEPVDPASLELQDILRITDGAGVVLKATGFSLSSDGLELTITLDGSKGSLNGIAVELSDNGNGNFIRDLNGNTLKPIESNLAPVLNLLTSPMTQTIMPGVYRMDASTSIDPDGDTNALTFNWLIESSTASQLPTFISNNASSLGGVKQAQILFSEAGYFGIRVEIRDSEGRLTSKLLSLRVVNQAPVANAGLDRSVRIGARASLFGNQSYDTNSHAQRSNIDSYEWSFVSGPQGAMPSLLDENTVIASFDSTGLAIGNYTFKLTTTDRDGAKSSDNVIITLVDDDSVIRTIDLGPARAAMIGTPIDLIAATRGLSGAATYEWSATPANLVNVISTNGTQATLQFIAAGTYQVSLLASEGGEQNLATIEVFVSDPAVNDVPTLVVEAPQAVNARSSFTLSTARSKDRLGAANLVTSWKHLSGPMLFETAREGNNITLFAVDSGVAELEVWVNDGSLNSRHQKVQVQVHRGATHLPQARASGAREVMLGTSLTLDLGASTDADGHNLTFTVEELSALGAEVSIVGTTLNFNPRISGLHRLAIRARDVSDISAPTVIEILVKNQGQDYATSVSASKASVDLNANNSVEIRAQVASGLSNLLWLQSAGAVAQISNPNAAITNVTLPQEAGEYQFTLYALQDGAWSEVSSLSVSAVGSEAAGISSNNEQNSSGCALGGTQMAAFGGAAALLVLLAFVLLRRRREDEPELTL